MRRLPGLAVQDESRASCYSCSLLDALYMGMIGMIWYGIMMYDDVWWWYDDGIKNRSMMVCWWHNDILPLNILLAKKEMPGSAPSAAKGTPPSPATSLQWWLGFSAQSAHSCHRSSSHCSGGTPSKRRVGAKIWQWVKTFYPWWT